MKPPVAVTRIFDALDRHHPDADTELVHRNAFELLVATMLSAQSTDARVNLVTPTLFKRYPNARALAGADTAELEGLIHATGFFRQKARSLIGMAIILVAEHRGEVPPSMAALTALPGVGRKTANVVLGHALGVPGLPVDRHVLRVAVRIGLVHGDDPVKIEAQLCDLLPPKRWTRASDTLILHGRRICKPKPACQICHVRPDCDFFRTGAVTRPIGRVRLKPDATSRTVRLKPDATSRTVRLKPDATSRTVRLKPDATSRTVRLKPDATSRTARLKPDATSKPGATSAPATTAKKAKKKARR